MPRTIIENARRQRDDIRDSGSGEDPGPPCTPQRQWFIGLTAEAEFEASHGEVWRMAPDLGLRGSAVPEEG